ncbi:EXS-domain-containing protein [Microstroma glucosiphilum]|uniref:EXS-domain-containing protein n=1 Tax=Pseudomicrostroma glucosiphilum TaxID=1684307 RepID=A0A316UFN1_9BASI|nr:EXS-domain-containing protein [Pseudomicrostroma glucosiphilum]PWN23748.1 EXS-domain-containing protein [Pseudomicrostroma glucosiphilum]
MSWGEERRIRSFPSTASQYETLHPRSSQHPFSEAFPPPYRVLLLISFGIFCWGLNIQVLNRLGIDTDDVLSPGQGSDRSHPNSSSNELPLHQTDSAPNQRRRAHAAPAAAPTSLRAHKSIYGLSATLAVWTIANWLLFRHYVTQQGGDPAGRHAQAFQGVAILAVFVAGVWPGNVIWRSVRKRFGQSLLSLILPAPLLLNSPTFPSILLADVLTSFAKVFGDVWLTACFLVPRKEHHTWWNGRGSWVVPLLVSLPYAIRLIQCLAEYQHTGARKRPGGGSHSVKSKRPLANALKYASAFPVIWISASQSSRAGGVPSEQNSNGLWFAWLLSILINSLFSYWWDVTNDWGLEGLKPSTWSSLTASTAVLFGSTRHHPARPVHRRGLSTWPAARGAASAHDDDADGEDDKLLGSNGLKGTDADGSANHRPGPLSTRILRPSSAAATDVPSTAMLFPPTVYHLAILLDLVLRFTWSLKLSPHLAQLVELESGVFVLEVAEIARRCGWVFLRVEWEVVKRKRAGWLLKERRTEENLEMSSAVRGGPAEGDAL